MAEEVKKTAKPKSSTKKNKLGIDTPTLIFFGVMIVGLIIFTIIIFSRPSSKIYSAQYGENFTVHAELYSNNTIDLAVDVGKDRIVQSGTYKEITDDDIEFNYIATFVPNVQNVEPVTVNLVIIDNTLTITYNDGEKIILKEST